MLPHEGVHPVQAAELADRMTEMGMNPAPILLVHRGPAAARELLRSVLDRAADHEFDDRNGDHHRIWAIRDPETSADLEQPCWPDSRALLADGHHRYAAYLRMQEARRGRLPTAAWPCWSTRTTRPCSSEPSTGSSSGPPSRRCTRRRRASGPSPPAARPTPWPPSLRGRWSSPTGREWATLALDLPAGTAAVEVLHSSVLPALETQPDRVEHHHSVDDTLRQLPRTGGVAVLMPAIEFDTVHRIVGGDRLLPEKATSFQPKPSMGVLMRSLRDE